jgi:hypothetical protein
MTQHPQPFVDILIKLHLIEVNVITTRGVVASPLGVLLQANIATTCGDYGEQHEYSLRSKRGHIRGLILQLYVNCSGAPGVLLDVFSVVRYISCEGFFATDGDCLGYIVFSHLHVDQGRD